MSTPHEMVRADTGGAPASDAQEWQCTVCTRRVLLRWPPHYERLVLDRGEDVPHHGGTAGLSLSTDVVHRSDDEGPVAEGPVAEDTAWLAEQGIRWEPEQPT